MGGMIRAFLCGALMCVCAGTAAAQTPRWPADAAQFEALLSRERYGDLSRAFAQVTAPEDVLLLANWQEAKVLAGAGVFLSHEYSQTLARAAAAFPHGPADFRETGASFLVYAYAVAVVDGFACQNPYFAAARSGAIAQSPADPLSIGLWRYIAGMSPDHGDFLIESALQMEAALDGKRAADSFLCGADGRKSKDASEPQRQDARAALNARVHAIVAGYRGK
jgi:hypothetical protein